MVMGIGTLTVRAHRMERIQRTEYS